MKRLLLGFALAATFAGVSVNAAPKTQASIILNTPALAAPTSSTSTWPKIGDWVNFTSIFPDSLNRYSMSIQVLCYQNGLLVFATAGRYDHSFLLGGTTSPWLTNGGPATCNADLYYWSTNGTKFNIVASTQFDVAG